MKYFIPILAFLCIVQVFAQTTMTLSSSVGQPAVGIRENETIKLQTGYLLTKQSAATTPIANNENARVPTAFGISSISPNPFNTACEIEFDIQNTQNVKMEIMDILGKVVETLINEELQPGHYSIKWSGEKLASGTYFARLSNGKEISTKQITYL